MKTISFEELRSDWYAANDYLPRLVVRAVTGVESIIFLGFPRQWIPFFVYLQLPWKGSVSPVSHLPFFSDLDEKALQGICDRAIQEGTIRSLVECAAALDALLADFLYIVDHKLFDRLEHRANLLPAGDPSCKVLPLTGWSSYGRPEILHFDATCCVRSRTSNIAAALPCARRRPYEKSRTHRKVYAALASQGHALEEIDLFVVSAIGVVPRLLWGHPVIQRYDAGAPDIYRVLCLLRRFFAANRYETVLDCLQFKPYSDLLRICKLEGRIRDVILIPVPRRKYFSPARIAAGGC